ncbi:MAG: hypothetical protein AAGE89_11625 [Pseudomonadota bacterium]
MLRLPHLALVVRKEALFRLEKSASELATILTFDAPYAQSDTILVYGPYFDFESLDEVCRRLTQMGLEYWDDFIDLKDDIPDWLALGVTAVSDSTSSS